jgi:uncharacterized protein YndB with AHSA1/START domain
MSGTPKGRPEGGDDALVFEVDLEAPPEKVWRAIATPEVRDAWLGAPEDGAARVAQADPPSRLDLVWPTREGDSLISFEISPAERGSRLTITHRAPQEARVLAFKPQTAIRARPAPASAPRWRMAA